VAPKERGTPEPYRLAWEIGQGKIAIDQEPGPLILPRLFAYAAPTEGSSGADAYSLRLYHCPTDPQEELRLTWDAIRHQHAGYCKACRKLWPLPRRTITREQLMLALHENAVEPEGA